MKIPNIEEEILESLWIDQVEKKKAFSNLDELANIEIETSALDDLSKIGYISTEDNKIKLLDKGKEYGQSIVRRHRLAERLLVDVLQLKKESVHSPSCQFEHILNEEVEENICILLGHPKICPHGKPIPQGKCCIQSKWLVESSIKPLSALAQGQRGKVVYLHTLDDKKLQKMMVMGVLPGREITLLHRFPSYVFQVGFTQVAVDSEIADSIYVILKKESSGKGKKKNKRGGVNDILE
ncbi:MAG: metal-dependent transcriptional regulator [Actinobacteria bacterium]|nr:metal-dependent transcriptional regulator [Actinomycetota bacterium]